MAPSSKKDVYPATISGYGRQLGNEIPGGGLANSVFSTWCPPDKKPNTRIITLCGITDYTGQPSIALSSSSNDESLMTSASGKGKKGVCGNALVKNQKSPQAARFVKDLSGK